MGGGGWKTLRQREQMSSKRWLCSGRPAKPKWLRVKGGRSCFLIVGTRVTRVYAVWEHSGLRVTCHPDPSVGTRWNLGELSESVAQRLSESKGVWESEVFTAVENRIQSRKVKLRAAYHHRHLRFAGGFRQYCLKTNRSVWEVERRCGWTMCLLSIFLSSWRHHLAELSILFLFWSSCKIKKEKKNSPRIVSTRS